MHKGDPKTAADKSVAAASGGNRNGTNHRRGKPSWGWEVSWGNLEKRPNAQALPRAELEIQFDWDFSKMQIIFWGCQHSLPVISTQCWSAPFPNPHPSLPSSQPPRAQGGYCWSKDGHRVNGAARICLSFLSIHTQKMGRTVPRTLGSPPAEPTARANTH